jgi:hypothetical protein
MVTAKRFLICLVAVLGCSGNHTSHAGGETAPQQQGVAAVLASSLVVEIGDNDVRLVFHITNTSNRPVELEFTSGQRYDFTVRRGESVVWRWAADRSFIQMIGQETVPAGGSLKYEERAPIREPGSYTATAELTSSSHPVRQTAAFERRPR